MAAAPSGDDRRREVLDPRIVDDMFDLPGRTGPSLFVEILGLFLKAEPARIAGLASRAHGRQGAELAHEAHQLAGSCAVIGATQLQGAARALEDAARANQWTAVAEKLAAVDRAWSALRVELAKRKLGPA
jgi:HPt (histidine-containing phosphotransfer) domain-containing protein